MPWPISTGNDVELPEFDFTPETTFTGGVLSDFSAWMNDDAQSYLTALGLMFETVYQIVIAQGNPDDPDTYEAGWSTLLDPTECPTEFLPYLAQFVGAQVQPGTPDAVARNQIVSLPAQSRGTPASIIAAAKTQLTGTQHVTMIERQGVSGPDPYHFIVIVKPGELASAPNLITAVDQVKPAGLQWTLVQTDGFTWNQAIHTWSQDTMTWQQTAIQQP